MRLSPPLVLTLAVAGIYAAGGLQDEKKKELLDPCTIASTTSGTFYDLRSLSVLPEEEGKKRKGGDGKKTPGSWHSKGYDYPSNFTLNICAPVVEEVSHVVGVEKNLWANVSAYYEYDNEVYSMGQGYSNLTLRGARLVLQYKDGSPCSTNRKRSKHHNGDDEDDAGLRRKSTTISFHCEKDPTVTQPVFSFVGTDPDECNYMFEVRSQEACGGSAPAKQGVGPGAVFSIMGVIAIMVYFLGGVFYQRNVAHARGWRQLPNYSMWAGIGNFIKDIFIICTSSCARFLPSRRGYRTLSISANDNHSSGRGHGPEDENNLIDQLDEEWDD